MTTRKIKDLASGGWTSQLGEHPVAPFRLPAAPATARSPRRPSAPAQRSPSTRTTKTRARNYNADASPRLWSIRPNESLPAAPHAVIGSSPKWKAKQTATDGTPHTYNHDMFAAPPVAKQVVQGRSSPKRLLSRHHQATSSNVVPTVHEPHDIFEDSPTSLLGLTAEQRTRNALATFERALEGRDESPQIVLPSSAAAARAAANTSSCDVVVALALRKVFAFATPLGRGGKYSPTAGGVGGGTAQRLPTTRDPAGGAVHPFVGLFQQADPTDLLVRYRAFCAEGLHSHLCDDTTVLSEPTTLTAVTSGDSRTHTAGADELDPNLVWQETEMAWRLIEEAPNIFHGPLLDDRLQLACLRAMVTRDSPHLTRGVLLRAMGIALDYNPAPLVGVFARQPEPPSPSHEDVRPPPVPPPLFSGRRQTGRVASTVDPISTASLPRTQRYESFRPPPQRGAATTELLRYRYTGPQGGSRTFSQVHCAICDVIAPPTTLRNMIFYLSCFDPMGIGKVPHDALLSANFITQFAKRHVWAGVMEAWVSLASTIGRLNRLRERQAHAVAQLAASQRSSAGSEVSDYAWAVETFVGPHDRQRTKRGYPLSDGVIGVPWNDARCVLFSDPTLVSCFRNQLRFGRWD